MRALQQRDDLTGEVGVVGFCFGGGLACNVSAVEPVAALVSYYGSSLPSLIELDLSMFHHPEASGLAWQRTTDFLQTVLPPA